MLQYSQTDPHAITWHSPASLGFATWKRHVSTDAVARLPLLLRKQDGLKAVYQRNMSLANGLIARHINRTGSDSEKDNFVFRLNRDSASKYGNAWSASRDLMPTYAASDGAKLETMSTGNPLRSGNMDSDPMDSASSHDLGKAGAFDYGGSSLKRTFAPGNDSMIYNMAYDIPKARIKPDSPATMPSKRIARSTVFSESTKIAENPVDSFPAEAHGYSKYSTSTLHEFDHAHPSPKTMSELVFPKFGSLAQSSFPHLRVQRRSVSLHRHSIDIAPGQRLPLRTSSAIIARQLQINGEGIPANPHPTPDWLPVNRQTLPKTIRRSALKVRRLEAGHARQEDSAYGNGRESTAGPPLHNMTESNDAKMRSIDSVSQVLSHSTRFLPAITAKRAQSYAGLITHRFEGSTHVADLHRSVLLTKPMPQRPTIHASPLYRSTKPQKPNDNSLWLPHQHSAQNRLPTSQMHWHDNLSVLRKGFPQAGSLASNRSTVLPEVVNIGAKMGQPIARSDFGLVQTLQPYAQNSLPTPQMHWHDNLSVLRKGFPPAGSLAPSRSTVLPEVVHTAAKIGQSIARSDFRLVQTPPVSPRSISNIASVQPAMQRSSTNLGFITADHTGVSTRQLRGASQSSSKAIPFSGYFSPNQGHRYNAPRISRRVGIHDFHRLENLALAPIIRSASSINRSKGYNNGFADSAISLQTIHSREQKPISDNKPIGSDDVLTNPAFHPAQNYISRRMAYARNAETTDTSGPKFLTLKNRVWPLNRLPMTASNASSGGGAGAAIFDSENNVPPSQDAIGKSGTRMPGASEQPLVVMRRARNMLMRDTVEATDRLPHSDHPVDRFGLASPPSEELGLPRVTPSAMPSTEVSGSTLDPEEIAEQAWRMIAERLVVERERRGLAEWN